MANHIGVIGAGVMGEALIAALIRSGENPSDIAFAEKRNDRAEELVNRYSIVHKELIDVAANSKILLLVVKPQDLPATLQELAPHCAPGTLVISFVAGKTIASIAAVLGESVSVVRVMPNTPALLGLGASGYSFGESVSGELRTFVSNFLAATGKAIEVPESLQDAVTATSGSWSGCPWFIERRCSYSDSSNNCRSGGNARTIGRLPNNFARKSDKP